MAINTSLLVTAPVLQEAIISKTAVPLANGTITCYQDDSRTTLKTGTTKQVHSAIILISHCQIL